MASSAMVLAGCKSLDDAFCSGGGCEWSAEEWARIQTLSPLPDPPADPSNQYVGNVAAIQLGQEFYFDPRFSGIATLVDGLNQPVPYARAPSGDAINVSCATCHDPKRAGGDFTSQNPVSIGAGWYDVNGQQTANAAYYPLLYWNGRTDSLWSQAAQVSESPVSMNGTRLATFWTIYDDLHYREAYDAVFGEQWPLPYAPTKADFPATGKPTQAAFDNMTLDNKLAVTRVWVNFAKAIAAYEYTLISRESAFDRFVAEGADSTAISPAAKRGARLFVGKASCIDCHNGPLLSDGGFHDIGVPQVGEHVPTVSDCPSTNTRCDCSPGEEKVTCLPSGAWAGLLRLANSVDTTGVNFNNTRRDSMWSDDVNDTSRAAYYNAPTDNALKGAWRTPSLRDAALTAPYMHDGYYRTLEDVVWHYNIGGAVSGSGQFDKMPARAVQIKPLGLRDDEAADLVEFLKTLTGTPLDAAKTSKPPVVDAGTSSSPDAGSPPDAGASDAASQ